MAENKVNMIDNNRAKSIPSFIFRHKAKTMKYIGGCPSKVYERFNTLAKLLAVVFKE